MQELHAHTHALGHWRHSARGAGGPPAHTRSIITRNTEIDFTEMFMSKINVTIILVRELCCNLYSGVVLCGTL